MLTVKKVNNEVVITVHRPKAHFSRPLTANEVDIVANFGEEIGANIILDKTHQWEDIEIFREKVSEKV